MNKVILMGRLTKNPDIRYSNNNGDQLCIANFTLAVDRNFKKGETDFISCKAFGKQGEFAEKYLQTGTKIVLIGRIQTGSYTNKEGKTVYTTDVIAEGVEFAESKKKDEPDQNTSADEFISVPDDAKDKLPFRPKN